MSKGKELSHILQIFNVKSFIDIRKTATMPQVAKEIGSHLSERRTIVLLLNR